MTEHLTKHEAEGPTFPRLDWNKLSWGLALLTLGLIFALDRFTDLGNFARLWPLMIAVLGGVRLVSAKSGEQVRTGLWLLATSSWLLINFFHLLGFDWRNSWPLWPMMAGVIHLLVPDKGESRWGGLIPLAVGIWLLLAVREVAGFNWSNSWPLVLIFVGLSIVVKALTEKHPVSTSKEGRDEN